MPRMRRAGMNDATSPPGPAPKGVQRGPIRVATMGRRGRGVVADAPILAGQLIERSPVLVIPHADRPAADATIVFTYVFMWEHGSVEEDLYRDEGHAAIALGLTSLLNHSDAPNCTFIPLCCTDRPWGRTEPCPWPGSRDADVLRASKVEHAVQHIDGNRHLGPLAPVRARAQRAADHPLEARDVGLGQGAPVVPGCFLGMRGSFCSGVPPWCMGRPVGHPRVGWYGGRALG